MKTKFTILFSVILLCINCKSQKSLLKEADETNTTSFSGPNTKQKSEPNDTTFVNLQDYSNDFVFDMKYATTENFLKTKVYDCAECYLRYKTVKALIVANSAFQKLGYRIKIFDCYRPLDVQKKMWKIVSNPKYVADPAKGSIHNRGGAVDITLVSNRGLELDMGTAFDYFGKEAAHNFKKFSTQILRNRKILKSVMVQHNFKVFESEWWHYDLVGAKNYSVSNFKWNCN